MRRLYPKVHIIARARNRQHAFKLMDLGVDDIVRETLHSSLLMTRQMLERIGVEARTAAERVESFHQFDEQLLRDGISPWWNASEIVLVEGAGGLFSPLGDTLLNADLAKDFCLPLVVVDAARLGAIGRTLATVTAARACGLAIAAVVLSHTHPSAGNPADPASPAGIARASAEELARRLAPVPVGVLAHEAARIEPVIDWPALASRG